VAVAIVIGVVTVVKRTKAEMPAAGQIA